jgi:hypothetical protein
MATQPKLNSETTTPATLPARPTKPGPSLVTSKRRRPSLEVLAKRLLTRQRLSHEERLRLLVAESLGFPVARPPMPEEPEEPEAVSKARLSQKTKPQPWPDSKIYTTRLVGRESVVDFLKPGRWNPAASPNPATGCIPCCVPGCPDSRYFRPEIVGPEASLVFKAPDWWPTLTLQARFFCRYHSHASQARANQILHPNYKTASPKALARRAWRGWPRPSLPVERPVYQLVLEDDGRMTDQLEKKIVPMTLRAPDWLRFNFEKALRTLVEPRHQKLKGPRLFKRLVRRIHG